MTKEQNKELLRYVVPTAGGLCVTYLYNIIDGIFVGWGVGHLALAAVNISVPFITSLVALSVLLEMGASTVIFIRLGRGDVKETNDAFMTGLSMTFLLSLILLVIGMALPDLVIFRTQAVRLFNKDAALVEMASAALPVFAVSFLFMAANLIYTAYFYSTKQTGKADIIAISRGVAVKAIAIFLVPVFLGDGYIWHSAAAAEGITLLICFRLRFRGQ